VTIDRSAKVSKQSTTCSIQQHASTNYQQTLIFPNPNGCQLGSFASKSNRRELLVNPKLPPTDMNE
jgi:hypothetical protein